VDALPAAMAEVVRQLASRSADLPTNGANPKMPSNADSVCRRFDSSRRRKLLTFDHHSEVAWIESNEEQDYWLDAAEVEGWSLHELRQQMRSFYTAAERPAAPASTYRSRPTKSRRRTKADMGTIRDAIHRVLAEDRPMTVRQVFYRLVAVGAVEKTESEYKGTVVRLLTDMRRSGEVPFGWIADNTRWMRKPRTYSGLEQALQRWAQNYRRAVWDNQDDYVEIWLEKDALAGVVYEVTAEWDVPLMVTRGYPSLTFLNGAGEAIEDYDKPAYLYYFGDYDPSGVDISRVVEQGIREFAPHADVHFERVAVTPDQIAAWKLPTRPTKKADTRSRNFRGESVEIDAIPPDRLRQLVEQRIVDHVDFRALEVLRTAEQSERQILKFRASEVVP